MSSGGAQQPIVTQTQTRDPWTGAQGDLMNAMATARTFQQQSTGYQPYTGTTQATMSPTEGWSIDVLRNIAAPEAYGTPQLNAAQALQTNVINQQGITPGIQTALGNLSNVGTQYGQLYSEAGGQENPYLQAMLNTQGQRIADRVNAAMSGAGRYGSGQHTDVLTRGLAEAANPILAQDYARRQQQRMQATQALGGLYGTMGDIYSRGLAQAGQYAQAIPALQEARYMPAKMTLGIGQYLTGRDQAMLNDQIRLYNAQQAWPWEQLARYNAIIQGAGGLGGTMVQAQTPYQAPLAQRLLGGALAGGGLGSAFGPVGAGVGALGGGLLGGFM